jgi:hypothetical protein
LDAIRPTTNRPRLAETPEPAPEPAERPASRIRAVPEGTEARGFALYVGIDEAKALAAGTDLPQIVEALKQLARSLSPEAETNAAVALAPVGAGGRDVDVVRLALQDPAALAKYRHTPPAEPVEPRGGVVIDISRKRVLIGTLWAEGDEEEVPNERTIDVHVRRLRSKLGAYEDIVRTVRGAGYRFDRHADVTIRWASTPSPDMF